MTPFVNQYTVVLDTCVLAPMPAADFLLRLGEAGFFIPKWSNDILIELRGFLQSRGKTETQINHRIEMMSLAFEDACISGYEDLVEGLNLPDKKDRHVLAAAIRGRADSIVSENIKDFPTSEVDKYGITIQNLDSFLVDQYQLSPSRFISTLKAQATKARRNPQQILQNLRASTLLQTLSL
jgi:hypothetical protein